MYPRYTLETVDGIDRRGRQRYPVTSPVTLTITADGQAYSCIVEDISLGGAKVRFYGSAALAADVQIAHPRTGKFNGECKWISGSTSGIAFHCDDAAVRLCVHCFKQMVPLQRPA